MKKFLIFIICACMLCLSVGCAEDIDSPDKKAETKKVFTQSITIVKMPFPPKCKNAESITVINDVLEVLSRLDKEPITDGNVNGGWYYMFKIDLNGEKLNYSVGGIFTDADGSQYRVSNWDEIKPEFDKIYDELEAEEKDYP